MNRTWNDEHLDHRLRDAMQSQPEHPPIAGLALRAVKQAQQQAAARLRPDRLRRYSRWQQFSIFAATAIVGVAVWFAAGHLAFQASYGDTETTVAGSARRAWCKCCRRTR